MHISELLSADKISRGLAGLATLLGLTAFADIYNLTKSGEWALLSVISVIPSLLILFALFQFLRPGTPQKSQKQDAKSTFSEPFKGNIDPHWSRSCLADRLRGAVHGAKKRNLIVVGASGSGKSTLVRDAFSEDTDCAVSKCKLSQLDCRASFHSFQARLNEMLSDMDTVTATLEYPEGLKLLVFDHAEALVGEWGEWRRQHVADTLLALESTEGWKVIFVVRKERYYDLSQYLQQRKVRFDTFHVSNIEKAEEIETYEEIKQSFMEVTGVENCDAVLADLGRANGVSPLDAQIVGRMLYVRSRALDASERSAYELDTSKDELIAEYFRHVVEEYSPSYDLAKILFCISATTMETEDAAVSIDVLAKVLLMRLDEVAGALEYLVDVGLVVIDEKKCNVPVGRHADSDSERGYRVAHDFVAERCLLADVLELDPIDRDWVQWRLRPGNETEGADLQEEGHESARGMFSGTIRKGGWSVIVFAVLAVVRFLTPEWETWYLLADSIHNFDAGRFVEGLWIDYYYIPVAATHLVWLCYINLMFRRFLDKVPLLEGDRARFVWSYGLTILGAALAVLCVFYTPGYVMLLSIVGMAFGARLLFIAKKCTVRSEARSILVAFGRKTMFNMVITGFLGFVLLVLPGPYLALDGELSDDDRAAVLFLFWTFGVVMVYYWWHIRATQWSPNAARRLLALSLRGVGRELRKTARSVTVCVDGVTIRLEGKAAAQISEGGKEELVNQISEAVNEWLKRSVGKG